MTSTTSLKNRTNQTDQVNPYNNLLALITKFTSFYITTPTIYTELRNNQKLALQTVFRAASNLMEAFETGATNNKVRRYLSTEHQAEWKDNVPEEEGIDAYLSGKRGINEFRLAVEGVNSLKGRIAVLAQIRDEGRESSAESATNVGAGGEEGEVFGLREKIDELIEAMKKAVDVEGRVVVGDCA